MKILQKLSVFLFAILFGTIFLCFDPLFGIQLRAKEQTLTIGARVDTKPFVWRPNDMAQPRGFLWDICILAVQRAGYSWKSKILSLEDRKKILEGLQSKKTDVDLLCDPTTITLQRINSFSSLKSNFRLSYSPILFVANGVEYSHKDSDVGYGWGQISSTINTQQKGMPSVKSNNSSVICEKLKLNAQSKTPRKTSNERYIQLTPSEISSDQVFEIWGYVETTTMDKTISKRAQQYSLEGRTVCLQSFSKYSDAAQAYCEKRILRVFGDADILRNALTEFGQRSGKPCNYSVSHSVFESTYEPYALVIRSNSDFPNLSVELTSALYSLFTDGTVEALFLAHFPQQNMSTFLENLIRLNQIPPG